MTDIYSWMDTKAVCDHLCVSPRTLERYRKREEGENPFPEPDDYCIGRTNKWQKAKVIAWQQAEIQQPKRKPLAHIHCIRDGRGRITRHSVA